MNRLIEKTSLVLAAAALLGGAVRQAEAVPTISVDMDPGTAGIQSSLGVGVGDTFTIDVVISDDGVAPSPTAFDTVILEALFNDLGAVLAPGPTGPLGGTLASNSFLTLDIFGLVPSATGAPLTAGPSFPAPPYTSGSGALGLLDPLLFTVFPGSPATVFSIDFTALSTGSSTILAAGTPAGSPPLSLAGVPIAAALVPGQVNVPEPAIALLFGAGLAGLGAARRRKGD